MDFTLTVNGQTHPLRLDPRVTLLDALREHLGLTGTKKGCDQGQCGACTVLIDGQRVLSCFCLAAAVTGAVTTIASGVTAASAGTTKARASRMVRATRRIWPPWTRETLDRARHPLLNESQGSALSSDAWLHGPTRRMERQT